MSGKIRSAADLEQLATAGQATLYPKRLKILIGSASCGVAMGARAVEAAAIQAVKDLKLDAVVCRTGCIGFCSQEPLLDLQLPGGPRVSYGQMTAEKTRTLLEGYAKRKELKPEWALGRFTGEEYVSTGQTHQYPAASAELARVPEWSKLDFYRQQKKVILRNCGAIDPNALPETVARGTYRGAVQAIAQMTPGGVIEQMIASGLRGRGGAAFPTGMKWRLARQAEADVKYVVCNADEGEPGAYMDRTVLEGDPHAVLEGMLIGSYAIGAREGFIYVRSEYPLAIEILEHAIAEAEKQGLLGDNILGTDWSFHVKVRRGAGAYICGEETALIESLEGHSGEPRTRPPYPVTHGLWGKPTVVNNVKTWASVAPIITRGADWYTGMGTKRTPGTTIFSLEGAVKNAGLVEVPFGITLRELVYGIGGAMQLLWQMPSLYREGFRFRPAFDFNHPGLRQIFRLMGPAIIGNASVQINVLVNTFFAASIHDPVRGVDGATAWLQYAFRFMQLPLGLFGVAIATATLPAIGRSAASGDMEEFRETLARSLGLVFLLTVPSSVGLMIMGHSIVGAIYEGRRFQAYDTHQTAVALAYYAMGLAGYSAVKVLAPAFYALKDSRTPMLVSLASIGINAVMAYSLVNQAGLGHAGLALSTSCVALFSFLVLFWVMRARIGGVHGRRLRETVVKVSVASLLMASAVWVSSTFMAHMLGTHPVARLADLAVSIPLGVAVLYFACRQLKVEELEMATRALAGPMLRRLGLR